MTADIGELLSIESERNNDWITRIPLPRRYERKYTQSNIARIQRDQTSLTIIGDKQILFSLRNGGAIIDGFRIKYIYHGFRDYSPAGLATDGRRYLTQNQVIQYVYKPKLDNEPRDSAAADYSHNPLRGCDPNNMPLAQKGQSSLFTSYHLRCDNASHTQSFAPPLSIDQIPFTGSENFMDLYRVHAG